MIELSVALPSRQYPVLIGVGATQRLPALVREAGADRVLFLADPGPSEYQRDRLRLEMVRAGLRVDTMLLPGGEAAKTLEVAAGCIDRLVSMEAGRDAAVVCLGGGAVGDLGGFVAATYMRGIQCFQVPTTLLAMVDSAVGGKTALNRPGVKNVVGVFQQPRAVVADLEFLATLPGRELDSAFAEVIKYGFALDPALIDFVSENAEALRDRETGLLVETVARCVAIKAAIVVEDEREAGRRALLNYGHTAGHALEAAAGGRLLHGEAVALGMRVAAELSVATGLCAQGTAEEQARLLRRFGLPEQVPGLDREVVLRAMGADKKNRGGVRHWVLLEGRGRASHGHAVPDSMLAVALSGVLASA